MRELFNLAQTTESVDIFIRQIQVQDLISQVYAWEYSSKSNVEKYKNVGWFTIAADYWEQNH